MRNRQRILNLFLIVSCASGALLADESEKFYLRLNRPSLPEIYEGRLPGNVAVPELPAGTVLVLDRTQYDAGYFTGMTYDNRRIVFRVSTQDGTLSPFESSEVVFANNPNLIFNGIVYKEGQGLNGRNMGLWYQTIDRTTGRSHLTHPSYTKATVRRDRSANTVSPPKPSRPATRTETEGTVCPDCDTPKQLKPQANNIMKEVLSKLDSEVAVPIMADRKRFSPLCSNFIDQHGQLGPWGTHLIKVIDEMDPSCFYNKMDVSDVCPKFSGFSLQKKKQFWAYVFASMATKESSCRPDAQAPGVNGLADGLFQLEYDKSLRTISGRDKKYCKSNVSTNTQDLNFQFECAASIFRDIHCRRDRSLANKGGYWHELNGADRKISELIKQFSGCY